MAPKQLPPYVSYRTFRNFLDSLAAQGLPARIDRSVLAHKSGTIQSQLLLSLQYLGLIRNGGFPTDRLERLVQAEGAERRKVLREAVRDAYPFLFDSSIRLESATSRQMEELFEKEGAGGETVRRGISFLIRLAREAGLKVSPYIRPHRRPRRSSGGPTRSDSRGEASRTAAAASPQRYDVTLQGGGSLTLRVLSDIYSLTREDRRLVFDLIDRIREFEVGPGRSEPRRGINPSEPPEE